MCSTEVSRFRIFYLIFNLTHISSWFLGCRCFLCALFIQFSGSQVAHMTWSSGRWETVPWCYYGHLRSMRAKVRSVATCWKWARVTSQKTGWYWQQNQFLKLITRWDVQQTCSEMASGSNLTSDYVKQECVLFLHHSVWQRLSISKSAASKGLQV